VIWLWQIPDGTAITSLLVNSRTDLATPAFWLAVGNIFWINVLLSGDNALVIALACRGLNARHRLWGMVLGAGCAMLLRIIFTGTVAGLMELPYLKLAGGLALLVISARLLVAEDEDEDGVETTSHLWHAVRIVVVADIVMSLDNVIAVAAAARGSLPLLILGLAISVPLIVVGAALITALLTRLPILIVAGAGLLGWIAGSVIATDSGLAPHLHALLEGRFGAWLDWVATTLGLPMRFTDPTSSIEPLLAGLGVIVVLIAGSLWRRRSQRYVMREVAGCHVKVLVK
jgi:YjbE family integral membrane protein